MNSKKISSILLVTGGILELAIAILHFVWPFNLIQLPDLKNVSTAFKDFIQLAFFALGLCMAIFAYLSFYFSKRILTGNNSALIFALSQVILWMFRLIFEKLLPVRVSLYSIENPSGIIIIAGIFIILIYLIPVFLLRRMVITN